MKTEWETGNLRASCSSYIVFCAKIVWGLKQNSAFTDDCLFLEKVFFIGFFVFFYSFFLLSLTKATQGTKEISKNDESSSNIISWLPQSS